MGTNPQGPTYGSLRRTQIDQKAVKKQQVNHEDIDYPSMLSRLVNGVHDSKLIIVGLCSIFPAS